MGLDALVKISWELWPSSGKLKQPSEKQHWDLLEEEVVFEVSEEGRPPSEFIIDFPYAWKNMKLLSTSHTRMGMSKADTTLRYKGVTNVNKHTKKKALVRVSNTTR